MTGSDEATPDPGEITRLLVSIGQGDRPALNRLFPIVYAELRALAHRQLARIRPGDTLQTTALVHEAYLKLLGAARPSGTTGGISSRSPAAPCDKSASITHVPGQRRSVAGKRRC